MENALNDQHIWLVHLGFALLAASYLVRDMLWLRTIAVCSSMLMITFNLIAYKFPIWGIVGWNVFFISINIYNLVKLVRERANITFDQREQSVYDAVFPHLAPHQFRKLVDLVDWRELQPGGVLASDGEHIDALNFIVSGRAAVQVGGQTVAEIAAGDFVGEMAYLSGQPASADVVVTEAALVAAWPTEPLKALTERDVAVRMALQGALAGDLVEKLRNKTHQASVVEELVDAPA